MFFNYPLNLTGWDIHGTLLLAFNIARKLDYFIQIGQKMTELNCYSSGVNNVNYVAIWFSVLLGSVPLGLCLSQIWYASLWMHYFKLMFSLFYCLSQMNIAPLFSTVKSYKGACIRMDKEESDQCAEEYNVLLEDSEERLWLIYLHTHNHKSCDRHSFQLSDKRRCTERLWYSLAYSLLLL